MIDKKLIGIHYTGASTERIQAVANKCWRGKYKSWHFNCQQFIGDVTHKEFRSDPYSYYSVMILLSAIAGAIIIGGTIYAPASATKNLQMEYKNHKISGG